MSSLVQSAAAFPRFDLIARAKKMLAEHDGLAHALIISVGFFVIVGAIKLSVG
ncbi:hypothetical protein [Phaeovulum sp. W22_SRMD_FR3]|uniref:hypothetical protein n=1 Tax=Phaeovulum sp. W22_SRMD_FR3 TaxID=3240274 RepID=UPI003F97C70A